jgi:hypothetical protein
MTSLFLQHRPQVAEQMETEHREEYLAKVEKRVATYEVKMLNPLREGKKVHMYGIDRGQCYDFSLFLPLVCIQN